MTIHHALVYLSIAVVYVAVAAVVIRLQPMHDRKIAMVVALILPVLWLIVQVYGIPSAVAK